LPKARPGTKPGLRDDAAIISFGQGGQSKRSGIQLSECRMAELKADVLVLGAGMDSASVFPSVTSITA
jgi:hypothetical protein